MAQAFDAYQAWLGIPPAESAQGGPNHYRLLGLLLFESNPVVIENAAGRAAAQVHGFQNGAYKLVAQRVLGEIAAARSCLTDPARKSAYDRELQARLRGGPAVATSVAAMPALHATPIQPLQPIVVQVPIPAQSPLPQAASLAQAPRPAGQRSAAPAVPAQPAGGIAPTTAATKSPAPQAKAAKFSIPQPVKIALGGAVGLLMGYFLVYFITGRDLVGVLPPRSLRQPAQVAGTTRPANPRLGGNNSIPTTPPSSYVPPNRINNPSAGLPFSGNFPQAPVTSNSTGGSVNSGLALSTTIEPSPPAPFTPTIPTPPTPNPQFNPASNSPTIPPPNPAPLPGTEPESPTPRAKQPTPAPDAQKAMLAELQSIYKSEFDRGLKTDGRQEFIGFLFSTARKLKSDPVAQFVLCREAYDRAMRLEDFITAADIVDELERNFDVDGYRFRMHLLTEAARTAKTPDERAPLILFAFDLAEHALATQQTGDVAKLANIAESLARTLPSRDIKAQTTARCTELRKSVEDLAPVTAALAKLQSDPADPAASLVAGRHRCFVLGDWPAGLKLLAQSDHAALGAAARLDLETKAEDRQAVVAIGDAWFELAQADPGLAPAFARAQHWYAQAQSSADGLQKVKLEKRIEQIAAMHLPKPAAPEAKPAAPPLASARFMLTRLKAFEPTNLMTAMSPQTVRTEGWSLSSSYLRADDEAQRARLQSPVNPTGEYQMALRIRRYSNSSSTPKLGVFVVGLPSLKSQFLVVLDYPIARKGFASFVTLNGYKKLEDNPTFKITENLTPRLESGREMVLVCAVKLQEIVVMLEGEKLIEYRGDMSKLTMTPEWAVPNTRSMFLGAHQGGFYIPAWSVAPLVDDAGKELPLLTEPLSDRFGPRGRPPFP